jgi:hypothetical protein
LAGGGRPLPEGVRGKMEAALGANFADVRVHVGRQAERIGAIAFALGSDIYFAPGRFQPDAVHGQHLLGHELAHVVQQRAGRVKNPLGSGLAVVQDHALEAEADRLGRHAAAHRVPVQAKMLPGAAQPSGTVRISPPISAGPDNYRLTAGGAGRQVGSVMVHVRGHGAVEVTDLQVAETQPGHGIGRMLVTSAAKTGQQFGQSKVTLAAPDNGSGHLTQWYKGMGFAQVGVNQRGHPRLEAPINRLVGAFAQRKPFPRSSSTLQAMQVVPRVDDVKTVVKPPNKTTEPTMAQRTKDGRPPRHAARLTRPKDPLSKTVSPQWVPFEPTFKDLEKYSTQMYGFSQGMLLRKLLRENPDDEDVKSVQGGVCGVLAPDWLDRKLVFDPLAPKVGTKKTNMKIIKKNVKKQVAATDALAADTSLDSDVVALNQHDLVILRQSASPRGILRSGCLRA